MNRKLILSSAAALIVGSGLWAQQTKTYEETFNIGEDAVLDINTSHANIEFETWNKNQVEVVATVTLENASDEEAKEYFGKEPITILGNSKEIKIKTTSDKVWASLADMDFDFDFNFDFEPMFESFSIEIPDIPEIAVLPEMPPLPPMPPMKVKSFDYSKYKKEGEKYMEEWTQEFEENFDEEYQKEMEEWGKRVEEKAKAWEERNADRLEKMEARMEERAKEMEKRAEEMEKRREELEKKREVAHEKRMEAREKQRAVSSKSKAPNILYFSSDGEPKKYEVKKSIKIKIPKSVKLKMNVRHGEVKLAANTKDIKASLRYASLLASTINGKDTKIDAAYSPLVVERWNAGNLSAKYSEKVKLAQVKDIRLNSTSSNIVIGNALNDVYIINDLGQTDINAIGDDFTRVFVSLKNGQLNTVLPQQNCQLKIVDKRSEVSYPNTLKVDVSKNGNSYVIQGFSQSKQQNAPAFEVNAEYSEVVIRE